MVGPAICLNPLAQLSRAFGSSMAIRLVAFGKVCFEEPTPSATGPVPLECSAATLLTSFQSPAKVWHHSSPHQNQHHVFHQDSLCLHLAQVTQPQEVALETEH